MSRSNRRCFVTSAAAGVTAGALVANRLVHSQTVEVRRDSNSQLQGAVVGLNQRGGKHIEKLINDPGSSIAVLCDVDEAVANKRADQVAEKQGSRPRVVRNYQEVLDDKSVDLVTLATPNHWHALGGIWAMQAGKHAYIEKPVSHNIYEGRALVEAVQKAKLVCQVGTQCRSSAAIIEAMEFMKAGGIGEVNFARALCYNRRKAIGSLGDYPIPASVDFDLWSGPAEYTMPKVTRPRFHYDWHWQRLYGNGDSGNQGPHQTDIARWGLGLDRHPQSILSYGGRIGYTAEMNDPNYRDAGDTPNTLVTLYDYGDKSIVFETRGLNCDSHAFDDQLNRLFKANDGNKIGVVFYGATGYLVQRSYTVCTAYDKDFNIIREFETKADPVESHFQNFLAAIRNNAPSSVTADAMVGHLSAAMSHLGNISYYLGEDHHASQGEILDAMQGNKVADDHADTLSRTVEHLKQNGVDLSATPLALGPSLEFDGAAERFTNSEEANQWLGREYRNDFKV